MQFYWIVITLCCALTFLSIFPHCMQKKKKKSPGSISFLHSSRCQTCVFTRPSAFQSLFVAQMIILLFSDAYPPYLCLGKSYTSWKGHLMKPSLIMPFGQFFFPHMWFNRFFCGLNRYVV